MSVAGSAARDAASLGERVLDWMLRRLDQAVRVEPYDLVLVHESVALKDVGASVHARGGSWRVTRVTGELTLRDVLPEADRLIAIVPVGFLPLPLDIAGRAYLGRILDVRADDVVAALSSRWCEALVDEDVAAAVFASLDTLEAKAGLWSLGVSVTAREVRAVLVAAELGAARLDRERDWELLARWILDGVPVFKARSLVRAALEEAQPKTGAWLAWALTEGSVSALCTAGALAATAEGARLAPAVPGSEGKQGELADLVDGALREVWRRSPQRAAEVLSDAERLARGTDLDAARHRLLRLPLEGALSTAARRALEGQPPDDVEIESFKRNLHAPALAEAIEVAADLARLARFMRLPTPAEGIGAHWLGHALRDVAWADLAYRRVRRALDLVPAWLADTARRLLAEWLTRRDELNVAFARGLAREWPALARSSDARQPLALHQLTRSLLRRLVDAGRSVFLIVLDGCDLASFIELVESLPPDRRVGLAVPDVRDAVLRDDLAVVGGLTVAISALPTVTSHARRALFAGEIPGNSALDDTESAAANVSADRVAWERNGALGETPRRLFLKGDLGADGRALIDALNVEPRRPEVIAAVFNGIDDALSSRETTALPRWSFGALGAGAMEALQVAVERGWCVMVTADHGHTPYVGPDRKVSPGELGHRFAGEARDGTVVFESGPLPRQPLHLLARFGAWFGQQRRGFHGGAGIEEVVVPLAFIGRVRGEQEGRVRAPSWWWTSEAIPALEPHAVVVPARAAALGPVVEIRSDVVGSEQTAAVEAWMESLSSDERRVVALVRENQSVRLSQIARQLGKAPMRASGLMQQLVRKLFELGHPCIAVETLPDSDRLYRYQPTDRGDR